MDANTAKLIPSRSRNSLIAWCQLYMAIEGRARAENTAHEVLVEFGFDAPRSCIVDAAGRRFLEVPRFDRHGALGRSGLELLVSSTGWPAASPVRTSSTTLSCGIAKRSPPTSTISAAMITRVSGILIMKVVPAGEPRFDQEPFAILLPRTPISR